MNAIDPIVIALDVDGTLFDGRTVDPAARQALTAASAAGHVIVIVTGRPWGDLPRIIPDVLALCTLAVCEHGAIIVDIESGDSVQLALSVGRSVVDEIAAAAPYALVRYDVTLGLPAEFRKVAEEACSQPDADCYVVGNKDSIAVVPTGVDKGTGLTDAVRRLGMTGSRIVAVGDALNDLPMFAVADVAAVVANADPELFVSGIEVAQETYGRGVAEVLTRVLGLAVR